MPQVDHILDPKKSLFLAILLGVCLIALLGVRSLGWPLIHDAPLMHYAAWLINQGATPYADVFDMNFPGTYLIHTTVISIFGTGDGGWRVFELLWLTATLGALYHLVRPLSRHGAALGTLVYAGYHLSSGPVQAGQRDFLLMLPLFLGASFFAKWGESEGQKQRWKNLLWAGLFLGIALTIKPTPVLFWGGLGFMALAWGLHRGVLKALVPAGSLFVVGLFPLFVCLVWVWSRGGLSAFFDLMTGYVFPLYSKVGRTGLMGHISPRHFLFLGLLLIPGVLGFLFWGQKRERRLQIIFFGVVYGVLHYVLQGKGWGYHLTPVGAFSAALFGATLPAFLRRGWVGAGPYLGLVAVLLLAISLKGLRGSGGEITHRMAQLEVLKERVAGCAEGGRTVQILETAHGGIHALLAQKVHQPTRFIYDFPFFHDVDQPVIQALRAELIEGLEAAPPGCVIFMEEGWPDGGYERLNGFPELEGFLEQAYSLDAEGKGYRIYEHR